TCSGGTSGLDRFSRRDADCRPSRPFRCGCYSLSRPSQKGPQSRCDPRVQQIDGSSTPSNIWNTRGEAPMRALVLATTLFAFIAAPALACGAGNGGRVQIPRIAASIDELLPQSELPSSEIDKVKALRAQIAKLMAVGKERSAREAEEQAMRILGYTKLY